jgi:hypothetical protein
MNFPDQHLALGRLQALTRRHFLGGAGLGIGAMALSSMLSPRRVAASDSGQPSQLYTSTWPERPRN